MDLNILRVIVERHISMGVVTLNHLLPDCPRKASLKVVQLRNSSQGMVIDGTISGAFCSDIFVDSGAEVTVVHPDVVSENVYLDRTILISGFQIETRTLLNAL